MKHRAGSSKIKYEHHMIEELRELLEKIEPWDEIKSIIPGAIKAIKSNNPLSLRTKYDTKTGVKCLAKSGTAVQEVFIVTTNREVFKRRLENFLQTS